MDLTVNATDPKSETVSGQFDRGEKSSKADRLDTIVGDVLARQCRAVEGTGDNETVMNELTIAHQHDPADDIPPTDADIPLHEWVTALTHPLLGPYPNGVTPRILDRMATEAGVSRFPDHARRRWHKMWSSSNHLCVYLSDEVKCGRLRRVRFGHYAGCFDTAGHFTGVSSVSSGYEQGTNGNGTSTAAQHSDTGTVPLKDETGELVGPMETGISVGRSFPITALFTISSPSSARDRASSFTSQNGNRRRNYRATLSNGDHDLDELQEAVLLDSAGVNQKSLQQPRRQRTKIRRHSLVLDEFGLPSLLEDPSFSGLVFSMGPDVQSWTVEQSAAFVQDFGFQDGAEAFMREEIDGIALMLLRRTDVLDGLHLKIGPAVKLYRYIRALQKLVCRKNEYQNGSSNGDA